MAYGIVHHFPGGTKEQYEATLAAVHPTRDSLPEGQFFHAAGGDLQYLAEAGVRVKGLFDTHRAATLLGWPKVGLADLVAAPRRAAAELDAVLAQRRHHPPAQVRVGAAQDQREGVVAQSHDYEGDPEHNRASSRAASAHAGRLGLCGEHVHVSSPGPRLQPWLPQPRINCV